RRECGLPERDDARPKREPLWTRWESRASPRWANPAGVSLLAAVLPYLRGACSDWEDALWAKSAVQTCLRINGAEVVLQAGLDLRAVISAAQSGQQHCGQRQRSGRFQRVHRLGFSHPPGGITSVR